MCGSDCPTCGTEYERLAMHWNRSTCQYQRFPDPQWERIKGLLMGDADLHGLGTLTHTSESE